MSFKLRGKTLVTSNVNGNFTKVPNNFFTVPGLNSTERLILMRLQYYPAGWTLAYTRLAKELHLDKSNVLDRWKSLIKKGFIIETEYSYSINYDLIESKSKVVKTYLNGGENLPSIGGENLPSKVVKTYLNGGENLPIEEDTKEKERENKTKEQEQKGQTNLLDENLFTFYTEEKEMITPTEKRLLMLRSTDIKVLPTKSNNNLTPTEEKEILTPTKEKEVLTPTISNNPKNMKKEDYRPTDEFLKMLFQSKEIISKYFLLYYGSNNLPIEMLLKFPEEERESNSNFKPVKQAYYQAVISTKKEIEKLGEIKSNQIELLFNDQAEEKEYQQAELVCEQQGRKLVTIQEKEELLMALRQFKQNKIK